MNGNNGQSGNGVDAMAKLEEDLQKLTHETNSSVVEPQPQMVETPAQPEIQDDVMEVPQTPTPAVDPVPTITPPVSTFTAPESLKKGSPMLIISLGLVVVALLVAIAYVVGMKYFSGAPKQIACTAEAKVCDDGTSVGRSGPNCEFDACPVVSATPEATPDPTANWKTYENTNAKISFKHPISQTESSTSVSGPHLGGPDLVVNFADRSTVSEGTDAPFDGFSVYEIEVAKLGLSFDTFLNKEVQSTKDNPMGTGIASAIKTSIGEKDFTYIDAETKIRRYFILSSDKKRIAIFSRTNKTTEFVNTFDQVLSTFKFLEATPAASPTVSPSSATTSSPSATPIAY